MNPFEADFFSNNIPSWNDCKEDRLNEIQNLLLEFYPDQGIAIKIKQVGGIELNSNNYYIETLRGKFLLKKWGGKISDVEINEICALTTNLTSKNIPISKLIPSFSQSLAIKFQNQIWSLFQFDEGLFFSGTTHELTSVAKAVGLLFSNLAEVDLNLLGLEKPEIRSVSDFQLYQDFFSKSNDLLNSFQETERELLIANKDLLQIEVEHIFNSDINLGRFQYSHFDLHPHNILMNEGELSTFLDLDSIRLMHSGYALGFASLKLCRQCVVNSGNAPKDVAHIWIEALSNSMSNNKQWIPFIADLAIAEVLRRIAIILRLNIDDRNPQWNTFLPIQLNHLKEARLLFNS